MAGSCGKKATQSSTEQRKEGPTAQLNRTLQMKLTTKADPGNHHKFDHIAVPDGVHQSSEPDVPLQPGLGGSSDVACRPSVR
jgi:hypothetical protein